MGDWTRPDTKVVQWRQWEGLGLEHLVLRQDPDEISAESVVICSGDHPSPSAIAFYAAKGWSSPIRISGEGYERAVKTALYRARGSF